MRKEKVVIIGTGPSGITAAIYLVRGGITPVIIEKGMPGGKVPLTYHISNYPGYSEIVGSDLALKMLDQLANNKIEITFDEVVSVEKVEDGVRVKTQQEEFIAEAVIIATGTEDRKLNIPGEDKFLGHGFSHCAVCDGSFFKGKPMAIIGGGNSAFEEALYLSTITDKVYIIHRRNEFRADQILVEKAEADKHIELLTPYIPKEIKGESNVSSFVITNVNLKEDKEIEVYGIFSYIGAEPNTNFIKDKNILNEKGYIVVNQKMETEVGGIFASGDVVEKELRQIVTATNDGAIAATNVLKYLKK